MVSISRKSNMGSWQTIISHEVNSGCSIDLANRSQCTAIDGLQTVRDLECSRPRKHFHREVDDTPVILKAC